MKLFNKVAIVTGGAMGNGLGIVKTFLKYGAKVVIFDYSDEIENALIELDNADVTGYKVDVRNKEMVNQCVQQVVEQYGHIDILVNNAGVCKLVTFEEMTDEERDYHFDINIIGTWNVTKACLPYMKNGNGSIVNLSSVTGPMVADSGEVAYATTKSAILGFTKSLAAELVKDGGLGSRPAPPLSGSGPSRPSPENPQSVIDGIESAIPMKRMGTIEELGELAAFLASEESSYITAQGIVIDGGSTLPETMTMGV